MSTQHNGVGGIGVKISAEMQSFFMLHHGEDYPDFSEAMFQLDIAKDAGSELDGFCYYLLVPGNTFVDVQNNAPLFLKKINKLFGTAFVEKDLIVVSDVWTC
jgi:hypothetical protein